MELHGEGLDSFDCGLVLDIIVVVSPVWEDNERGEELILALVAADVEETLLVSLDHKSQDGEVGGGGVRLWSVDDGRHSPPPVLWWKRVDTSDGGLGVITKSEGRKASSKASHAVVVLRALDEVAGLAIFGLVASPTDTVASLDGRVLSMDIIDNWKILAKFGLHNVEEVAASPGEWWVGEDTGDNSSNEAGLCWIGAALVDKFLACLLDHHVQCVDEGYWKLGVISHHPRRRSDRAIAWRCQKPVWVDGWNGDRGALLSGGLRWLQRIEQDVTEVLCL